MEPGPAPGALRFTLTTLYGSDFEGGHASHDGNAPDGTPIDVPLYRHEVSLDYARIELALQYAFAENWDVTARIPWEQKAQHAGITFVENATPAERAAMQRNIDIHHRTVTLRGMGDVMLLAKRRWPAMWRDGDALSISAGTSIPTGRTIENPYIAGDRDEQHLHIQFGTGTFDPLLEASYSAPIRGRISAGGYVAARAPLYENSHGFRGATDVTLAAFGALRATERLQLRLEAAAYRQGYAAWNGVRDENSGLVSTSITAGATLQLRGVSVSADVRHPLSQRTLHEGDAFTQGATVVVSVGGTLRPR